MNLFDGRKATAPEQIERVKAMARECWRVSEQTTIMVTELECREPGCPPIETVIALLEGPGRNRQYKIHKPAADVSRSDVERLAAGEDAHHVH